MSNNVSEITLTVNSNDNSREWSVYYNRAIHCMHMLNTTIQTPTESDVLHAWLTNNHAAKLLLHQVSDRWGDDKFTGVYELANNTFLHVRQWSSTPQGYAISGAADSYEFIVSLLAGLRSICAPHLEIEAEVNVAFISMASNGTPDRRTRNIKAPNWDSMSINYSEPVNMAMQKLMAKTHNTIRGRLIILHGEPGTGKTWSIKALMRAWRYWCAFTYITDPENFFGNASYMQMTIEHQEDWAGSKYNLLICEDSGEFVMSDARANQGQALSRLLNSSDGLLGSGGKSLTLLTTNEKISSLNDAVKRPGRCLAEIEVGPLSVPEARRFAEAHGIVYNGSKPVKLAELYALREEDEKITTEPLRKSIGFGQPDTKPQRGGIIVGASKV